jgi:hypothetical protein
MDFWVQLSYPDVPVTTYTNSLGIAAVSMSMATPAENIKCPKPSADNIVAGNATLCHPTLLSTGYFIRK